MTADFFKNQKSKCYFPYQRKRLSNFDTDTPLRGQCQDIAHCDAIHHLEDLWDIENLQGVWESRDTKRGKLIQKEHSFF